MKITFNKFERVAGLFVGTAILGAIFATVGVAVKKGWFSSKIQYVTNVESADGLHEGTAVQIAGIRAGSVTEVNLISAEEIEIKFKVLEKFRKRIREDSKVQVVRPFIIGEKVLEVSVGSENQREVKFNGFIEARKSYDMMDLVSGRKIGPLLASIEGLVSNMSTLAEAFSDSKRAASVVKMFDRLEPMIANVNEMAIGMTKISSTVLRKKRLEILIPNVVSLLKEVNQLMPVLRKEMPIMYKNIPSLVENLNSLTEEFKKITPAISAVAPKLPKASLRAVELLDEAVVLLKAMQRSFLLSGKVQDIRGEEKNAQESEQVLKEMKEFERDPSASSDKKE